MGFQAIKCHFCSQIDTKHWKTLYTKQVRATWEEENEKTKRGISLHGSLQTISTFMYNCFFFLYEKYTGYFINRVRVFLMVL